MIPLIVIRPEPGNAETLSAAHVLGLEALGFPLFEVAPLAWSLPETPTDAILAGSANAFRHGGAQLAALRDRPVYAVGAQTAVAAEAAGFTLAATGEGGLQNLLGAIDPVHRRILRLCGRERVPLQAPAQIKVTERVVYSSEPVAMPKELVERLRRPSVVALHSARAAGHFAAECQARDIDRATIRLAAIGSKVAAAAGNGWAGIDSAERPTDAALLALARALCQTARSASGEGPSRRDVR